MVFVVFVPLLKGDVSSKAHLRVTALLQPHSQKRYSKKETRAIARREHERYQEGNKGILARG